MVHINNFNGLNYILPRNAKSPNGMNLQQSQADNQLLFAGQDESNVDVDLLGNFDEISESDTQTPQAWPAILVGLWKGIKFIMAASTVFDVVDSISSDEGVHKNNEKSEKVEVHNKQQEPKKDGDKKNKKS